jgi:peroxiredoxin (alkyl hydroperoxide reductase subunit C)
MLRKQKGQIFRNVVVLSVFILLGIAHAQSDTYKDSIYDIGILKPIDSTPTLKVGDKAPDFSLRSIGGLKVSLSQFLEKKNVVISFIPAAWSPICSLQWPEYNNEKDMFDKYDAILLGISVDNIPTLHSWTKNMCEGDKAIWFPVLSDFYPQGAVAQKYGIFRSDGLSERALFVIDKKRIIRFIDIHDINKKPPLMELKKALEDLNE